MRGDLKAENVCQIAHYHTISGGCGLEDMVIYSWGKDADAYEENAWRHLETIVTREFPKHQYYKADVPLHESKNVIRTKMPMPFNLCQDALARDINQISKVPDSDIEALGPIYHQNPE
eukprot:11972164-Karenia_brevis.AAC.1